MGQWIDFKVLRSKLSFAAVLDHYGVNLKGKGDQAQGFCPLPGHKGERRSPSFSANLKRGIWQCFGCGAKGNVLDFAIRMEGLSPDRNADVRTVALRLRDRFQIDCVSDGRPGDVRPEGNSPAQTGSTGPQSSEQPLLPLVGESSSDSVRMPVRINEPLDFELKGLQADHPYLWSRRFSPETVRHFGIGFCSRGLMAGRIVIPLHDTKGRLVGYAGRVIDDAAISEDNPKYRFPSKRERKGVLHEFHKSHLLYNAHRIKGPVDQLVVVEGFSSVWWLHQAGIENVVALMGSSCSPEQSAIIQAVTSTAGRIAVFPDGDDAGERCAQSVFGAVGPHRWIRWVRLPAGRQPTDCQPDELAQFFRV